MNLEEENRLLRGAVIDPNTNIDAWLKLKLENEHLKLRLQKSRENNNRLQVEVSRIKKEKSLFNKIMKRIRE